jgi:hypothetical protein
MRLVAATGQTSSDGPQFHPVSVPLAAIIAWGGSGELGSGKIPSISRFVGLKAAHGGSLLHHTHERSFRWLEAHLIKLGKSA